MMVIIACGLMDQGNNERKIPILKVVLNLEI